MAKYIIYNTIADLPKQNIQPATDHPEVSYKGKKYFLVGSMPKSSNMRIKDFLLLLFKISRVLAIYPLFHPKTFLSSIQKNHHKFHEKNIKVLCREPYAKLPKDLNLAKDPQALRKAILDCKQRYAKIVKDKKYLKQHPFLGRINWVPGEFGQWMPGTALVASHLAKKHDLKGLRVCETLESLTKGIETIAASKQDEKAAFIVPCFSASLQSDHQFFQPNFPQHKVTVCVEKQSGQIKIALLDAQPMRGNDYIQAAQVEDRKNIWAGLYQPGSFNSQELIYRAILNARLPHSTQFFYSGVLREVVYGCVTYALRDAVTFLKSPDFFNRIKYGSSSTVLTDGKKIDRIDWLPPAFMVGTQSYGRLAAYVRQYPAEAQEKLPGKNKSLQDVMTANEVTVDGKHQNHYITWKMVKYLRLTLDRIEHLNQKEIEKTANQTLVH